MEQINNEMIRLIVGNKFQHPRMVKNTCYCKKTDNNLTEIDGFHVDLNFFLPKIYLSVV